MQKSRLFELVYILLDKKKITATELAVHFEVSKRTILRDIDALTQAGIPIYTTKGKGGGISIFEHFILNKTAITDIEQEQILLALQSLTATNNLDASNLLSKLGALFNKSDISWIEVDFSRWGNHVADKELFSMLKQSILAKQSLSFTYLSTYIEITVRTVIPLKLLFKSRAWYLQAYCLGKNEYRTFKITRMMDISVLAQNYSERIFTPPPIDVADYDVTAIVHLKLLFSSQAAYRIYDAFHDAIVTKNNDNTYTVLLDTYNDN